MEEELQSVISNGEKVTDASDSSSCTQSQLASKSQKTDNIVSHTKFKGVVPQQNGHWGAQIYASHHRVWLGTFKSASEAAMAYDSAAIKLRSGDSYRNFQWTSITLREPDFQKAFSTEAVLNMIRDGSYRSNFASFLRNRTHNEIPETGINLMNLHANGGLRWNPLFQKELTPSDVGKLNRLVIPKKYAIKYFPATSEGSIEGNVENMVDGKVNDVHLVFYDRSMKLWKFRYCYWSSSQSYVFTRGWNRFIKEKRLRANDVISFYGCASIEQLKVGKRLFMIDVNDGESTQPLDITPTQSFNQKVDLQLRLGTEVVKDETIGKVEESKQENETDGRNRIRFRLFGKEII